MFGIRKFTAVEEKFPLVGVIEKGITLTRGGKYARVMELSGKDYSGLDHEVIEGLFQARKLFFESLPPEITVMVQSHRQKLVRDIDVESYSVPIAGEIAKEWAKNFRTSYRTRHFIVFVTQLDDIIDQIALAAQKRDTSTTEELKKILNDEFEKSLVRLADYRPREIIGEELFSYWAWMLNGKHVRQQATSNGLFDDLLSGVDLLWPRFKRHQIYSGSKDRYSAWLVIKAPANNSSSNLLENLFKTKEEFSLFQTFSLMSKEKAGKEIEDKANNAMMFSKGAAIILTELEELQSRVQAEEIGLVRHRLALEVFADSLRDLENAVNSVNKVIEAWGYRCAREKVNQEALFWSRFPEMQNFNPRVRTLTTENASHFSTFVSVGEGIESCSWGQQPVTLFKNDHGSEFSFTFHATTAKMALGNTIIIGGSESGKTTTLSFLFSQCFKYPDFRILAFDRLNGLEMFTHFHDGKYYNFQDRIDLNPLSLKNTTENKTFLSQFFQMLAGKNDERSKNEITDAIRVLFDLDERDRTLDNVMLAFGLKESGSVRAALQKWLTGETYGSVFTSVYDSLNFENHLTTFDMTSIIDNPDILGPMTYYIFHKLFLNAREHDNGYIVFIDEIARYLKNPFFAPHIEMLLQEIRKTDGVFVGAAQDARTFLDHPISPKIKNNIATYLLFPEPRAEKEYYVDGLGLNEREFEWIKKPQKRQLLIKRRDGESVIVNCDLSPLGKYLKVFDSSSSSINKARELKGMYPDEWKELYLD